MVRLPGAIAVITLLQGDCLEIMRGLADCSVDSIVTDPPAGINFMSKDWDTDHGGRDAFVSWLTERLAEATRLLKPGGHALVWAMPRTSGWTQRAIEDAGLVPRDCLVHLFGTGFPKSHDIGKRIDKEAGATREIISVKRGRFRDTGPDMGATSMNLPKTGDSRKVGADGYQLTDITAPATPEAQQWDGWGTALKPASEHWWLARKPLSESTVAGNVLKWGTGGIHVDACRVGAEEGDSTSDGSAGRWPPNVVLTHSATVYACECGQDGAPDVDHAATDDCRYDIWQQGCEQVGTRRVKTAMAIRRKGIEAGEGWGTFGKVDGDAAGYADADGLETVQAWNCATPTCADACVRLLSSLQDSLACCPACHGFCDAQSHLVVKVGREILPSLTGAAVVGSPSLQSKLEDILQNPGRFRATMDAECPCATTGSSAENRTVPESPHVASLEPVPHTDRREELEQPLGGQRDSTAGSNTAVFDGSCEKSDHSACRRDAVVVLVRLSSVSIVPGFCPVAELDTQSGTRPGFASGGATPGPIGNDVYGEGWQRNSNPATYGDTGGASRFFNTFKYQAKAPRSERPEAIDGTKHPTVKPLDLMKWLIRLVTPPHGTILDPFAGSGTTGQAAEQEGFDSILIENDPKSVEMTLDRVVPTQRGSNQTVIVPNIVDMDDDIFAQHFALRHSGTVTAPMETLRRFHEFGHTKAHQHREPVVQEVAS